MSRAARQRRQASLRNRLVDGVECAPAACVVCGRPKPDAEEPEASSVRASAVPARGWIYLAGSVPMGAIACSALCANKAIARHGRTGRVDVPAMRRGRAS